MASGGRRSIRLDGWDYGWAGWYFVTVCTHERRPLLARVVGGRMVDTAIGLVLRDVWHSVPHHHPSVGLQDFVILPDHFHGIVCLEESGPRLGTVIRSLKSETTKLARQQFPDLGRLWQRNYYEHVIRREKALDAIRRYIENNPRAWIEQHGNGAAG